MADIELVVKIPENTYRRIQALDSNDYFEHDICGFSMRRIANGTPLTSDMLADLLMEERIRGELHSDTTFEKDIIRDVKCRLTVSIRDRRPCYCGADLREVWRESEGEEK